MKSVVGLPKYRLPGARPFREQKSRRIIVRILKHESAQWVTRSIASGSASPPIRLAEGFRRFAEVDRCGRKADRPPQCANVCLAFESGDSIGR